MVERRKKPRADTAESHPLARTARLRTKREERRSAPRSDERQRVTFLLPRTLIERLRDAVHGTAGATMAGLVAQSLERTVDELEHLRGAAFPRRRKALKAGRPRK